MAVQLMLVPSKRMLDASRSRALRIRRKLEEDTILNASECTPLQFAYEQVEHTPFPPDVVTCDDEIDIVRRACASFDPKAFEEAGCAVCGQLVLKTKLTKLKEVKGLLSVLEIDGCARLEAKEGGKAPADWTGPVIDSTCDQICGECRVSIRKGNIPRYALAKGLWIGNVPQELAELRFVERLLVARVRHTVCWAKVSSGMKKMKANVVAFESPIPRLYSMLPPPREDMEEVLAVFFTGPVKLTAEEMKKLRPFLVRRNHVRKALDWLKLNHCDYADIGISQDNLDSYPEDVPPVIVEYIPKLGNKSADNTAVYDMNDEDGTEEGECPFTVHGITARDINETISVNRLRALSLHH
ncbi:hypothetical protein NMY22_g18752 [Coprinellus aureogranulatus]|nr:hypothetical protein NMY22_g18752 [Coprinellus aureogranulatus]